MNIPQDTLQAVADAAFGNSQLAWGHASHARRAVIQHALSNPALAPFLAGGVGEYTDEEIGIAFDKVPMIAQATTLDLLRAFLAALPRRESPALADAIARAEKTEKELAALKGDMLIAERAVDNVLKILPEMVKSPSWEDAAIAVREHIDKLQEELAALKSVQLGILRPIAEMPETVPEGCFMISGWQTSGKGWLMNIARHPGDTHFAILRLPAAEANLTDRLAAQVEAHLQERLEHRKQWHAEVKASLVEPEPDAQVPLGPEDCPPGSVFTFGAAAVWITPLCVSSDGVGFPETEPDKPLIQKFSFELLKEVAKINTSLPDTGRWDANAWRPCSKPAGKEVAK